MFQRIEGKKVAQVVGGEPLPGEAEQFANHADALVDCTGSDTLTPITFEKRTCGAIELC